MKEITVVFRPEWLPKVNELLYRRKVGFLFYDINGRAREKLDEIPEIVSREAPYATGRKYTPHFVGGVKLEIVVSDSMTKPIVDELMSILSTGSDSDGRVIVKDVPYGYDIGSKSNLDTIPIMEVE